MLWNFLFSSTFCLYCCLRWHRYVYKGSWTSLLQPQWEKRQRSSLPAGPLVSSFHFFSFSFFSSSVDKKQAVFQNKAMPSFRNSTHLRRNCLHRVKVSPLSKHLLFWFRLLFNEILLSQCQALVFLNSVWISAAWLRALFVPPRLFKYECASSIVNQSPLLWNVVWIFQWESPGHKDKRLHPHSLLWSKSSLFNTETLEKDLSKCESHCVILIPYISSAYVYSLQFVIIFLGLGDLFSFLFCHPEHISNRLKWALSQNYFQDWLIIDYLP